MGIVDAASFLHPVSFSDYPDYHHFVSVPMDLTTLWRKINGNIPANSGKNTLNYSGYVSLSAFRADLELIAANCETYCRDRYPAMPPVRE